MARRGVITPSESEASVDERSMCLDAGVERILDALCEDGTAKREREPVADATADDDVLAAVLAADRDRDD